MEIFSDLLNKISINHLDVGSAHWVDVTHINNPHSFYVRHTHYRRYLPVLNAVGNPLEQCDLQEMKTLVYKSEILQMYVRGQVLFTENKEDELFSDILAIDYGCIDRCIPTKKLFNTVHPHNVPPLAIHCRLADCMPKNETWNGKDIETMKFYIGKERAKMIIKGKNPDTLIVELFNTCPDDIATMLALCGYTTLGYAENKISRFSSIIPTKNYFIFKEPSVGEQLTVRVQSGDSLKSFFVSDVSDYKFYLNTKNDFTFSAKNLREIRGEDVKEGLPVGVLVDTYAKYERAIVKKITIQDSRVKVQLVDWGKELEVPFSYLKPISEHFLSYPAIAIFCEAEESQAWDNGLHKFLYPGYEFKITILSVGQKFDTPFVVNIEPHNKPKPKSSTHC